MLYLCLGQLQIVPGQSWLTSQWSIVAKASRLVECSRERDVVNVECISITSGSGSRKLDIQPVGGEFHGPIRALAQDRADVLQLNGYKSRNTLSSLIKHTATECVLDATKQNQVLNCLHVLQEIQVDNADTGRQRFVPWWGVLAVMMIRQLYIEVKAP